MDKKALHLKTFLKNIDKSTKNTDEIKIYLYLQILKIFYTK